MDRKVTIRQAPRANVHDRTFAIRLTHLPLNQSQIHHFKPLEAECPAIISQTVERSEPAGQGGTAGLVQNPSTGAGARNKVVAGTVVQCHGLDLINQAGVGQVFEGGHGDWFLFHRQIMS